MIVGKEIAVEKLRGALEKMIGYADQYLKRWPSSDGDKKEVADAKAVLLATPAGHLSDATNATAVLQKYIDDEVPTLRSRVQSLKSNCDELLAVLQMFRDGNPVVGRHIIHNPQVTMRASELSGDVVKRAEANLAV